MALHERRMSLPAGAAYKAITQQMLPCMVAWFALDAFSFLFAVQLTV
jgi:hypothetical protein